MKLRIPLVLLFLMVMLSPAFSGLNLQPVDKLAINDPAQRAKLPYVFGDKAYVVADVPQLNDAMPLQYLGDGHYLFAIDPQAVPAVTPVLSYIDPAYKFLQDVDLSADKGSFSVVIVFAPGTDVTAFATELARLQLSVQEWNTGFNRVKCTGTAEALRAVAQLPVVLVISKNYVNKNPLIYDGMQMNRVTQIQDDVPFGYNLKGEGTSIGIWDDGAIGPHFNLSPKRVFNIDKAYAFGVFVNHPTWVAGAAGMAPAYFETLKGPAYRSKLYSWDYYNDIIQEIKDGIDKYGLNITNHSYNYANTTCAASGLYIPEAADLDKLVRDYPKVLHTIAVGNTGTTCIDTFNSVDIGYQGCKNVITVGWIFTQQTSVPNSGRGPTTDGRLKPDLTTKGFGVLTTSPGNNFTNTFGSSFAAPQVAGLAALLQQRYKQQFGDWPNASLIKAILCNTAADLGNPGPDYTFGFGRPDALKAVRTIEENRFFEDAISTGETQVRTFTVASGTGRVAVSIDWIDPAGFPFADVILVNDLDLKLVTPANDTILPWKLDPLNYKKYAKRGVDQLNNTEQVTIDYPVPGEYQIVVKGSKVPVGPQTYSVAYNADKVGIDVTFPDGGERLDAGGSYFVHWNYIGTDTTVNIEYSTNGGQSWNVIANNVNVRNRYYSGWVIPNIPSKTCKVRLTYAGKKDSSAAYFSIGQQVNYGTISAQVCDRTARLSWSAVAGASAYRVYLYTNDNWVLQGQTTGTTYTINNLLNGTSYLYSVSCIRDSVESNHSLANLITPVPGNCTATSDAGVYALFKPQIGRQQTSMQLGAAEKLSFVIKNYGTNSITGFNVKYTLNGGPVRTQAVTDVLTGNDSSLLQFNVTENLSALGNYIVKAWTELPGETNTGNDTITYTIRNLANAPLTLPFTEGFEGAFSSMTYSAYGVNGTDYADYQAEPGGRARTNEGNTYANSGLVGLTLDNYRELASVRNDYIFTLNLSGYVDSSLYLDLAYMSRGDMDSNDKLYARGKDTDPWVEIYDLYAGATVSGNFIPVKAIDLYRILKLQNSQAFSSSTQIRIGTQGLRRANDPYAGGGYSFDDLVLYNANRDVALRSASIKSLSCQRDVQPLPLTVFIQNNSRDTLKNLPVYYSINQGPAVTELIPVNIKPYDTLTYTFTTKVNVTQTGAYTIRTWVSRPGDNYRLNDTAATVTTLVLPTITEFPYYNDFESDATLVADGQNSSWTWGSPAKYYTRHAAQGEKCWANSLYGTYNFDENSSLYLGCFDLSGLDKDPLLAFNHLQNIGTNSDTVYAELSSDGNTWKRLGCVGCGDNWYVNDDDKNYWDETVFPWQVASTYLQRDSIVDPSNAIIRLRLNSDISGNGEGFPVDDLHIYTDVQEIAATDSIYLVANSTGNGWIRFENNGKTVAELYDDNRSLGQVTLGYYARVSGVPTFLNHNYVPRNWMVRVQNPQAGNYKLRVYLPNDEYLSFIFEDDSSFSMGDISLLRYTGLNTNLSPDDNHVRSYYRWYTPEEIQFYPAKGGYFVEAVVDSLGEFYLIGSKPDPDATPAINLVNLTVVPVNDDAYLQWQTKTESNSNTFVIQYSFDGVNFISLDTVPAAGNSTSLIDYNYIHEVNATNAVFYYRILIRDNSGNRSYSLIDSVRFNSAVPVFTNTRAISAFISTGDVIINNIKRLSGEYTARILRPDGSLLFSRNIQFTDGWNALGVKQLNAWPAGTYLLELYNDNERYFAKLLNTP